MTKLPSTMTLPEIFARWHSKRPWPMPISPQPSLTMEPPLAGELERRAAHTAERQEWETDGGTVKPMIAPGPKLPL